MTHCFLRLNAIQETLYNDDIAVVTCPLRQTALAEVTRGFVVGCV